MLPKAYDPSATEDRIYQMWEQSGVFIANNQSEKKSFSIAMPPPNATGQLHLGHAVMLALQDIFARYQRMRGKEVLWLPGTDHAAIATEAVVIKQIQKEEKIADPRGKLGREELVRRIAHFVEKSRGTIRGQVRKMGSSCDWSRERYTMEPALNRCVNEVFVKMYKDGLIYRGHRIVNWDPKMQTTVSDDEIIYEERKEPFYTFKYGPFEISTSRPETKFGDKYVVMHPDDPRYASYKHGDQFEAEWINGPVTATIIKDKAVDPAFGTGVMTITPWHDAVDFEIAEHQKLDKVQIIGFDGKLLPIAGEFSGMKIEDARPKIVEKLKGKGLLVSVKEDYVHNVALSQRSKGMIEPQIKEQWFIDVNKRVVKWKRRELSLKEVMQEVVKTGLIKIIPDRFEKTYFHWIDNLRDWCISRQIWWGHRIPVWYKEDRGSVEMHVGVQPPEKSQIPNPKSQILEAWVQDPDTLDTWFSSALWTWSTLIDPKLAENPDLTLEEMLLKSPDFLKFHPTDVMETGYDILFFWVARMILMTTYVTGPMAELEYGQVPFDTVYLHGLIRTRDGRKMSKSDPDTMIDPLDMISKYGADALRLSMIVGQSPGNDSRLYEEKIAGYRNFVNKLWNASRFVLIACENSPDATAKDLHCIIFDLNDVRLSVADKWILSETQVLIQDVTEGLQNYRLSEVGERLYSFTWESFCDWYIELSKEYPNYRVLIYVLRTLLKLLHPYCPFVTEELWSYMYPADLKQKLLLGQDWPVIEERLKNEEAAFEINTMIRCIKAIRQLRVEHGIPAGEKITVEIKPFKDSVFYVHQADIFRLAKLDYIREPFSWIDGRPPASSPNFVDLKGDFELSLNIPIADPKEEAKKLIKEQKGLMNFLKSAKAKLKNKEFISKAPEKVVEAEKEKVKSLEEKLQKIGKRLQSL